MKRAAARLTARRPEGPFEEVGLFVEAGKAEEVVGARQWALSSTVRMPDRVRLLSGLDANEQDTDLFLHKNDQVAKTLTIPHRDAWVVSLLERLANHQGGPSDIEYWSNEMKVTPQNLCEALDYLVGEGFLEKTA